MGNNKKVCILVPLPKNTKYLLLHRIIKSPGHSHHKTCSLKVSFQPVRSGGLGMHLYSLLCYAEKRFQEIRAQKVI